jgi:hypothetical protein
MHVILQTNHSFLFNKRSVAVSSRQRGRCQLDMVNKLLIPANLCGRSSPDRNARAGVGVRCSRERTHVQSPNPGSRCARLAGAVHRDDRHLDPATGEFVTVVVVRPAACHQHVDHAIAWSRRARRSTPPHRYTLWAAPNCRTFSPGSSALARAAFARRHIACAKDQRSSHFGACRVCFQLAGRRGVTVLKPLVFGNHLRAKQEDDAGDFEAQQPDNRGRQRAVDDADD